MGCLECVNLVAKEVSETLDFIEIALSDWEIRGQGEDHLHRKTIYFI